PTFQLRNTNSTIEESLQRVEQIQELCLRNNKLLVIYLSMGFGNPYGDPYSAEVLLRWADEMVQREVSVISLADTVGLATPEQISFALDTLIPLYPATSFGVHLHSTPSNWEEKMQAAVNAGCKRFDGALRGVGGCPMAGDALVGNMSTELMAGWLEQRNLLPPMNKEAFRHCLQMAGELFSGH
ncbi:MAG TPA: hydroxymethylglutaryl-CoA lyase, partial [Flavisolibacter sp.]|nr:hydroxymethylglutaryl-CoA lyase [Flavisolibacter sp.]